MEFRQANAHGFDCYALNNCKKALPDSYDTSSLSLWPKPGGPPPAIPATVLRTSRIVKRATAWDRTYLTMDESLGSYQWTNHICLLNLQKPLLHSSIFSLHWALYFEDHMVYSPNHFNFKIFPKLQKNTLPLSFAALFKLLNLDISLWTLLWLYIVHLRAKEFF